MKKDFTDILLESVSLAECIEDNKYKCILIRAGETNTANKKITVNGKTVLAKKYYTSEAIKSAVDRGLFENCPALLRSVNEHLGNDNTGINQYVGNFTNVHFNETTQSAEGIFTIAGNSTLAQDLKTNIKNIITSGIDVGLSIAGQIKGVITKIKEVYTVVVSEIESLQSVDVVPKGNAGGKIVSLIAEAEKTFTNKNFSKLTGDKTMSQEIKQKIFDLLNAAGLISEGKTVETVSEEDLTNGLYQHAYTLASTQGTTMGEAEKVKNLLSEFLNKGTPQMQKLISDAKKLVSQNYLTLKLAESKLPEPIKEKIRKQIGDDTLENEKIDSIFVAEQDALSKLNPSFINNGGADIRLGADEIDKFQKQMDFILLDPNTFRKLSTAEQEAYKDFRGRVSFKELYEKYTGDKQVIGKVYSGAMGESIDTTTFSEILGVSMHRSLLAEYNTSRFNADWRNIVTIVPRNDFKVNTVTKVGGYDDLPAVAQNAPYDAVTTPGEEAVTYSLLKRGYTETVSMEAIRNDDLGAIRRIPIAWGRAAMRTLYKYVFNLILTNPAMAYDTKALIHADHNNILNAALDATSYLNARKLLAQQKEKNSNAIIGFTPKYLLVGIDQEKIAYELTNSAYGMNNDVPAFHQTWKVVPIVIAHQNSNDWHLIAEPSEGSLIELGFLDGNEEPELFVQDLPTQGYTFSNDGIKYKIRHIYAGTNVDHRPIVGSKVN